MMELREPKRKRRVPVKCQQPFPVPIGSLTDDITFNGVHRIYIGQYAGNNVLVNSPEDMTILNSMGFFGKGSLSRGAPSFGKWKMDTPPFIYNRQWKRRCEWVKTHKRSSIEDTEKMLTDRKFADGGGQNCREMGDLNVKNTDKGLNSDVPIKSEMKTELVDVDNDIMIEHVKSEDEKVKSDVECNSKKVTPSKSVVCDVPASKQNLSPVATEAHNEEMTNSNDSADIDTKQGQTVVVLADSDCDSGDEDYLLNLNPRLEQEEFPIQESLQLTLEEAFFLSYGLGCLQILDMLGNELTIADLWKLFQQSQPDFVEKYVVYHYFRSKGWIVKPGIKFGGDFLLYKQGPVFYHASYIVYLRVMSNTGMHEQEDKTLSWTQYIGLNRLAETAGKEILLCNVIWPHDVPRTAISPSPKILEKFTVQEVLLRRWVSSQEREEIENEDIMN